MHRLLALFNILILLSAAACSAAGSSTPERTQVPLANLLISPTRSPTLIPAGSQLVVFAAASLTGAFQEIGQAFEAAHLGVKVNFNFAGSQILRTQIEQGASADIFASADRKNVDTLVADHLISADPVKDFATNSLEVIMPPGNPGNIMRLSDLARPGLKLVLADASVPAGNYARQALVKMSQDPAFGTDFSNKVLANVVSNETDVKQVVAKVQLGEADAGIVYVSDALAATGLSSLAIPANFNVIATYLIAVLDSAPEPGLAQAFVAYVTSPEGQAILARWGFAAAAK